MKKTVASLLVLALLPALNSCGLLFGGNSPSDTGFLVRYDKGTDPTLCPGGLVGTFTIDGNVVKTQTVAPQTDYNIFFDTALVRRGAVFRVEGRCLSESGATLIQNSRQGVINADYNLYNTIYAVSVILIPTTDSFLSDPTCADSVTAKPKPICIRTVLH